MFDFLHNVSANQTVAAVHYALRRLEYKEFAGASIDSTIEPLPADTRQLALSIIEEIQKTERTQLSTISQLRAEQYTVALARIAEDAIAKEFKFDIGQGQRLLEEMRKTGIRKIPPRRPEPLPAFEAYERFGVSNLASVLCIDVVGFSNATLDGQREEIELLMNSIRHAIFAASYKLDDVVSLPAGDGVCLCFTANVDVVLRVAEKIQLALAEHGKTTTRRKTISVRMGVDVGGLLRIQDLSGGYSLIGTAIFTALQVMNWGKAGHILCTENAYRHLRRLKGFKGKLKPIKERLTVKHGTRIKVYSYVRPSLGVGRDWETKHAGVISGVSTKGAN